MGQPYNKQRDLSTNAISYVSRAFNSSCFALSYFPANSQYLDFNRNTPGLMSRRAGSDFVMPAVTDLKAYEHPPQLDACINAVTTTQPRKNHRAFHLTLPTHAAKLLTSSLSSSLSTV